MQESGRLQYPKVDASLAWHPRYWWVLAALLLCLIPLCFLGYGSDNDIYGVLQCGRETWTLHQPRTSRNPGYWTYELLIFCLSNIGGYVLCNLASLAVSAALVWRFCRLAVRMGVGYPVTMAACLIVTPIYAIASATTMDYLWALICLVLMVETMLADRMGWSIALGALTVSFRAADCVLVAGGIGLAVGYELWNARRFTRQAVRLVAIGFGSAAFGCLPYLASYHYAGDSMSFLQGMIGPAWMWSLKMRVGRFGYKGAYALGPAALVVCGIALVKWWPQAKGWLAGALDPELTLVCLGIFLANVALFLKYPIEISYLIPAVFFFLLLTGATLFRSARSLSIALLVAIASLNGVLPQFFKPINPGNSTGARLHIALVPGTLLEDIALRRKVIGCNAVGGVDCWAARAGVHVGE